MNIERALALLFKARVLILHSRYFQTALELLARRVSIDNEVRRKVGGKKPSRQELIDMTNMMTQSKLFRLDSEFNIFDQSITRVLDLGSVPGNWAFFSQNRLCQIHSIDLEKFQEKCHIAGFDILVGESLPGISSIQGNIYSKMSHHNILLHFQEIAVKKEIKYSTSLEQTVYPQEQSYFAKEQEDSVVEQDLESITDGVHSLSIRDSLIKTKTPSSRTEGYKNIPYKPQLVLSDLSVPLMQQSGFFSNTVSRPHLRFGAKEALNKPIVDPLKAPIDLADAALLLCSNILAPTGRFVLRLYKTDPGDPELDLLHDRLLKVFNKVHKWGESVGNVNSSSNEELFFVCFDKKEDKEININQIFQF
ncbi:uncharacterized protein PRCAT00000150001 [Priceomyces carsonii]|uniref:uncharacterized protein n=1 Tax=Priceomyces carsonii TaxID=28549 RepID=UPI002ED82317|nr:unnamed protein product [Priceomyces carsonii]